MRNNLFKIISHSTIHMIYNNLRIINENMRNENEKSFAGKARSFSPRNENIIFKKGQKHRT